ncbi:hypothetical protein [uncultured Kocuria sp.]|uniref:hypothetical protein n=1 Tax=uncultured Kocuria sp. TaxID=259305 RepID=UPI002594FF24|nr:hypothetical protein [uncultured Kocuria sp.]MCT1368028.1 hypothetical protein [Rothia sp. p3-SID1597]
MHFSSFGIGVAITVLTVVVAGLSLRYTMRKNRAGGDGGPTVAGTPVRRQRTTALVLLAGWAWLGFGVYIVVTSLLGPGDGAAIILGLPVLAAGAFFMIWFRNVYKEFDAHEMRWHGITGGEHRMLYREIEHFRCETSESNRHVSIYLAGINGQEVKVYLSIYDASTLLRQLQYRLDHGKWADRPLGPGDAGPKDFLSRSVTLKPTDLSDPRVRDDA